MNSTVDTNRIQNSLHTSLGIQQMLKVGNVNDAISLSTVRVNQSHVFVIGSCEKNVMVES